MLFSIHPARAGLLQFPIPAPPLEAIAGGRSSADSPSPPKVLVIERDSQICDQIGMALQNHGYQIAEALSADRGLQLARQIDPDIILLDSGLSNRLTYCQELQRSWSAPGIFLLNATEDSQGLSCAFDLGIVDVIGKPIHEVVLIQRIKRWWQGKQQLQQLSEANQELQRLAGIDRLTQVANRHYFDEALEREVRQMKRSGTPLSLILMDIDYFKRYNDRYGHLQGDRCLQQIAQGIQQAVRCPQDMVARYGGEEFAAILPQTNANGAVIVARRIRHQIQQLAIAHPDSDVSPFITLSLGITCAFPEENCSASQLIQAADRGLYRAKEQGRDRLENYDNDDENLDSQL
ncbi:GGDEF domain-containing response regulator [Roseofilum casamattae]|uniref:Diguanylate cyclase n=1 Tax=Roseofilum casamattae BLCC-M143 TaxID=3022442 RepID=A0ABT7BZD6_9CYAN|nr:diguanylate cyclase [Roseofilum casamattae]MDJ1184569.1 diguanylate cyclase [Roseofilum casamattae BLCC-M143]